MENPSERQVVQHHSATSEGVLPTAWLRVSLEKQYLDTEDHFGRGFTHYLGPDSLQPSEVSVMIRVTPQVRPGPDSNCGYFILSDGLRNGPDSIGRFGCEAIFLFMRGGPTGVVIFIVNDYYAGPICKLEDMQATVEDPGGEVGDLLQGSVNEWFTLKFHFCWSDSTCSVSINDKFLGFKGQTPASFPFRCKRCSGLRQLTMVSVNGGYACDWTDMLVLP